MKLRIKILSGIAALVLVAISALAVVLGYESPCPAAPPPVAGAESMRAVMQRCYGSPKVLAVEDIAIPAPRDGELLIKVQAAGVNPYELHMTTGKPYILRFFTGLGAPDSPRLGSDFAGIVESVGAGVTRFKSGDEVFGSARGALAEYLVAREDGNVALKPAEMTFEQAAAIPIAAVTALQALRDHGRIAAGQKVLINGASGGVGTYAVQIAKSYGAEVTGVCSTRNVELVRSLGADHVIDYTKENFTEGSEPYDLIVDTAGNHGTLDLLGVVKPDGVLVRVGGSTRDPWIGPLWGMVKRKVMASFVDQTVVGFIARINPADLAFLAGLVRDGRMLTALDRRYQLDETAAALDYIGTRCARGKVIVTPD